MQKLLKVEGNQFLSRDVCTKAIINTSNSEYNTYLKNKASALKKIDQIRLHAEEIHSLKQDIINTFEINKSLDLLLF